MGGRTASDFLHRNAFPTGLTGIGFKCSTRLQTRALSEPWSMRRSIRRGARSVGAHPRRVLVIWGKQDPSVPFEASGPLLDTMPRARLVAVEDSGHLPQWEQPAITQAAILTFLHEMK
jgi:pimeloyl-ACP methyl ester carboxylesterase